MVSQAYSMDEHSELTFLSILYRVRKKSGVAARPGSSLLRKPTGLFLRHKAALRVFSLPSHVTSVRSNDAKQTVHPEIIPNMKRFTFRI